MKICVAQTRPVKGDILSNIEGHKKLIDLAVSFKAETIIFPELSITGYEPSMAKKLATDQDDDRFNEFQIISNDKKIILGLGVPIRNRENVSISMILFQPGKPRQVYSKKHLHADEEGFFVSGRNIPVLEAEKTRIALAICYEISVPAHSEDAFKNGAAIYIASVAKSVTGVAKAIDHLSGIANKYSMTVFMSNCVGYCDNFECGGKSSVWNNKGTLIGQLNEKNEGILIFDTESKEIIEETLY